jgi:hypothetical protein
MSDDLARTQAVLAQADREIDKAKPMPPQLAAELDSHKRRDPYFDPEMDRSQMSKQLRRWFDKLADHEA